MPLERRNARRYSLSLPVEIGLTTKHPMVWYRGVVRDVSSQGVCFIFDGNLTVGVPLHLKIGLPTDPTGIGSVRIEVLATAIRIAKCGEDKDEHVEAAATIKRYDIVRT